MSFSITAMGRPGEVLAQLEATDVTDPLAARLRDGLIETFRTAPGDRDPGFCERRYLVHAYGHGSGGSPASLTAIIQSHLVPDPAPREPAP